MYIETKKQQYRCVGQPVMEGETLRFLLPEGGPQELGATVALKQDDGFLLREVEVSGYLRWGMEGETLVITNLPTPEPAPEVPPEPPAPAEAEVTVADLAAAVVDLAYEIDSMKLERMGEM